MGNCAPLVDLSADIPVADQNTATIDSVNGDYDNLIVDFTMSNIGLGDLPVSSNISYLASVSSVTYEATSTINYFQNALASTDQSGLMNPAVAFNDVPPGTHTFCAQVNLDGATNYPENDTTNFINNRNCWDYTLDPITSGTNLDLTVIGPSVNENNAIADGVTGMYDDLDVSMVIDNLGPDSLPADSSISYLANVIYDPAIAAAFGLPATETTSVGYYEAAITAGSPSPSLTPTPEFNDIPFGTHTFCARVNLDGSTNFPETDYGNNENCVPITIDIPPPPLSLTAADLVIRRDNQAELTWDVNVAYPLNCTVQGAGGIDEAFDTIGGPVTTNMTTPQPLNSTSDYILSCTEPISGEVFTEEITVEVLPEIQEI